MWNLPTGKQVRKLEAGSTIFHSTFNTEWMDSWKIKNIRNSSKEKSWQNANIFQNHTP